MSVGIIGTNVAASQTQDIKKNEYDPVEALERFNEIRTSATQNRDEVQASAAKSRELAKTLLNSAPRAPDMVTISPPTAQQLEYKAELDAAVAQVRLAQRTGNMNIPASTDADGNIYKGTRGVYSIDDNLHINTPRPADSLEKLAASMNESRSLRDGRVFRTPAENFVRYIEVNGMPLDRVLDDAYRATMEDLTQVLQAHDDLELAKANGDSEEWIEAKAGILAMREQSLANRLGQYQGDIDYYGAADYAQEVFAKRSQQEYGFSVSLQQLYNQYGANAEAWARSL